MGLNQKCMAEKCGSGQTAEGIFHFRMNPNTQPQQLVLVLVKKKFLSRVYHTIGHKNIYVASNLPHNL